jgi:hypothetical protein
MNLNSCPSLARSIDRFLTSLTPTTTTTTIHWQVRDMYGEKFCNGFFGASTGCSREDFVVLSLVWNRY